MVWLALLGVLIGFGSVGALVSLPITGPGERHPEAFLPLGFAAVLIVSLPLSRWLPMITIAWAGAIACLVVACILLIRTRHRIRWRGLARALATPGIVAPVVASAIAAIPIAVVGFPTAIAWATGDIYAYPAGAEWLVHNSVGEMLSSVGDPAGSLILNQLVFGFLMAPEHLSAAFASLTGADGYEWLGVILAAGAGISVAGWLALVRAVTGRAPTWVQAIGATAGGLVAPLITAMADGYASQFLALCIAPFVLATWWSLFQQPTPRRVAVAAVAMAASLSTYLGVLPWIALALAAMLGLALITAPGLGLRRRDVVRGLAATLAITALLAPLQLAQLTTNFRFLSTEPGYPGFPGPTRGGLAAVATGTTWIGQVMSATPLDMATKAVLAIVALAIVAVLVISGLRGTRVLVVVAIAVVLMTVAFAYQYIVRVPYPYGAYKAMISGGSLLLGLTIVAAFIGRGGRGDRGAIALIVLGIGLIALWIPITATALDAQANGTEGFRAPERTVQDAIEGLPAGSVVLVESSSHSLPTFNMRMFAVAMSAAIQTASIEGIGTTATYLTAGSDPAWRPTRAWDYVLGNDPSLRQGMRTMLLSARPYTLWRAPLLDVTTYGLDWSPSEGNGSAQWAWLSGPGEILASNASGRLVRATVSARIAVINRSRTVTVTVNGDPRLQLRVSPLQPTELNLQVVIRPHSVARIALDATPRSETTVPNDSRSLLIRVTQPEITGWQSAR